MTRAFAAPVRSAMSGRRCQGWAQAATAFAFVTTTNRARQAQAAARPGTTWPSTEPITPACSTRLSRLALDLVTLGGSKSASAARGK
jgi:hypothetical protein